MSTPDEFVTAAAAAGLVVQRIPRRADNEPPGVNVFAADERVPGTTVWWPRPGFPNDQIIWGDHFDSGVHPDVTAERLVELVRETLG